MPNSMTGFGRSTYTNNLREYTIEIKSVNHKYCDVSIKLPRIISYLEDKIKKIISSSVSRGKIDVYINFTDDSTEGKNVKINTEIAKLYIEQLKKLAEESKIEDKINVMDITKLPDVLNIENNEDEEQIWNELEIAIKEALDNFIKMRKIEGEKIKEDLCARVDEIAINVEKISEYSTGLVKEYVVKLEERIKELLKTDVDQARLAQEVVIFADKCSVEEEITRLKSHISQFKKMIKTDEPIGKKMDFLIQEMNREANTIGSKANSIDITNLVVEIKTQIENIREQVQNIE